MEKTTKFKGKMDLQSSYELSFLAQVNKITNNVSVLEVTYT